MLSIKFTGDNLPRHKCVGVKEGNWLIFKCCECSYIRKINLKTGKSKTYNSDFDILHEGSFSEMETPKSPPEFLN